MEADAYNSENKTSENYLAVLAKLAGVAPHTLQEKTQDTTVPERNNLATTEYPRRSLPELLFASGWNPNNGSLLTENNLVFDARGNIHRIQPKEIQKEENYLHQLSVLSKESSNPEKSDGTANKMATGQSTSEPTSSQTSDDSMSSEDESEEQLISRHRKSHSKDRAIARQPQEPFYFNTRSIAIVIVVALLVNCLYEHCTNPPFQSEDRLQTLRPSLFKTTHELSSSVADSVSAKKLPSYEQVLDLASTPLTYVESTVGHVYQSLLDHTTDFNEQFTATTQQKIEKLEEVLHSSPGLEQQVLGRLGQLEKLASDKRAAHGSSENKEAPARVLKIKRPNEGSFGKTSKNQTFLTAKSKSNIFASVCKPLKKFWYSIFKSKLL